MTNIVMEKGIFSSLPESGYPNLFGNTQVSHHCRQEELKR